jgi:hypothetical protein
MTKAHFKSSNHMLIFNKMCVLVRINYMFPFQRGSHWCTVAPAACCYPICRQKRAKTSQLINNVNKY